MANKKIIGLCLLLLLFQSVQTQTTLLNNAVSTLTNIIVHDVFTPPASSRIYAYTTVAAYSVIRLGDTSYASLNKTIHNFPEINPPENNTQINYPLAGIFAFYYTAKSFVYSEADIDNALAELRLNASANFQLLSEEIENSENFGKLVAEKIIAWSALDGYAESRTFPRYTLMEKEGSWVPTPPDYSDAMEPYWGKLRTFVLDSAFQFRVQSNIPFSTDTKSAFYKQAFEVYQIASPLSTEQQLIARFWDDNPFATNTIGHLQFAEKKISPVGHWLDITREAIEITETEIVKASLIYALLSISNADAIISAWAEKYRSNVLRPVTYINLYIDAGWLPFLQTPAFPEHTSGHSTTSACSATILTYYFGNNFTFTDASETDFDLPSRTFSSFIEAANEATNSRFYGGIHYKESLSSGFEQGEKIANYVLEEFYRH